MPFGLISFDDTTSVPNCLPILHVSLVCLCLHAFLLPFKSGFFPCSLLKSIHQYFLHFLRFTCKSSTCISYREMFTLTVIDHCIFISVTFLPTSTFGIFHDFLYTCIQTFTGTTLQAGHISSVRCRCYCLRCPGQTVTSPTFHR